MSQASKAKGVVVPQPPVSANNLESLIMSLQQQLSQMENRESAMKAQVDTLTDQNQQLATQIAAGVPTLVSKPVKIPLPAKYNGNRAGLRGFVTQMKAYFLHYASDFSTEDLKVRIASQQLEGRALDWFEPILRDYLEETRRDQDQETKDIFGDFDVFCDRLTETFGNPDEERDAERQLTALKQQRSTADYAAEFRQIASKLEWADEPLMNLFYNGLKDPVKDELCKEDRPNLLSQFIERAVRIDNRQYERQMEKRGKGTMGSARNGANTKKKVQQPSTRYGTHPGPMELDATQKKPVRGKCYNCGKEGHFSRYCKKPKKDGWKPVPEATKNASTAQKGDEGQKRVTIAMMRRMVSTEGSEPSDDDSVSRTRQAREIIDGVMRDLQHASVLQERQITRQQARLFRGTTVERDPEEGSQVTEDNEERAHDYPRGQRPEPGPFETITVKGRTASRALGEGNLYQFSTNDHPIISPLGMDHERLAYFNCIDDLCSIHYQEKLTDDFFPAKEADELILRYYNAYDVRYFKKQDNPVRHASGYADYEWDNCVPFECRNDNATWQQCQDARCAKHKDEKVEDWHVHQRRRHLRPTPAMRRQRAIETARRRVPPGEESNTESENDSGRM
jgi:hypothetical protein